MKSNELLMVAVAAAGGCTTHAPEPDFHSPIGVERLTIEESDATLAVTGYAANGDLIARIDLRTGTFYFDEFEREVEGRQLRVDVRGRVATHESAGQRALKLPLFKEAGGTELNELLLDPRVRPLLSSWQIEIQDTRPNPLLVPSVPPGDSSTPYHSCIFTPTASCSGNGAYSCAESYRYYLNDILQCKEGVEQDVCCASTANGGTQQAGVRICGMGSSNNPCGMEGPQGCAICWTTTWRTFCTASTGGQSGSFCTDGLGTQYFFSFEQLSLSHD